MTSGRRYRTGQVHRMMEGYSQCDLLIMRSQGHSQSEARKDKHKLPSAPPVRGSFQRFPSDWVPSHPSTIHDPRKSQSEGETPPFQVLLHRRGGSGQRIGINLDPRPLTLDPTGCP